MPFRVTPKVVSRGTFKKTRWRATVTVMCPDRVPVQQTASLFVDIRWRQGRSGEGQTGHPDDTNGVLLKFRQQSAASGEILFDGPAQRGFAADTRQLFAIYGNAGSGTDGDVVLEVKIDGDTETTIPLTVNSPSASIDLRDESGTNPAPEYVLLGETVNVQGQVDSSPVELRRISVFEDELSVHGGPVAETVGVQGERASGSIGQLPLCVMFEPEGGEALMLVHHMTRVQDTDTHVESQDLWNGNGVVTVTGGQWNNRIQSSHWVIRPDERPLG